MNGHIKRDNFYPEVCDFFKAALNYIRDKFPHNDIVVNNAIISDLTKRATVDITSVYAVLERFPRMLEKDKLTSLENKFLEYQLLDDDELPDMSLIMVDGTSENRRVDKVWGEIVNTENLVTARKLSL